jgi:hypothetical protein
MKARILLYVLLASTVCFNANGAPKTWKPVGAAPYYWNNGSNWLGGLPVAGDVIVFDGTASNADCNIDISPPNFAAIQVINNYSGTIDMMGHDLNFVQSPFGANNIFSGTFKNTSATYNTFKIRATTGGYLTDIGTATLGVGPTFGSLINIDIALTSGSIQVRNTSIYGSVILEAPSIPDIYANYFNLDDATNTTSIKKTGAGNNTWGARNIFFGDTFLEQNGTGALDVQLITSGDVFMKSLELKKTNSGTFTPCKYASLVGGGCSVAGNFSLICNMAATSFANQALVMTGTGTISNTGTNPYTSITLEYLTISSSAAISTDTVKLATPVNVGKLEMTKGILATTTSNYVNIINLGSVTGGSDDSYVIGPVRKTGKLPTGVTTFTFPFGAFGLFRPLTISEPGNASHFFIGQYYNTDPHTAIGSNKVAAINNFSGCEYWSLIKSNPGSNVDVTLSWNSFLCTDYNVTNLAHPQVIRWDGTTWQNHGNGASSGSPAAPPYTTGTVKAAATITSWSAYPSPTYFTLGSTSSATVLPIELTDFTGTPNSEGYNLLEWTTASELNNLKFEIQRSFSGLEFSTIGELPGAGTTNSPNEYKFTDPYPANLNYYRLKQTDYDGKFTYSKIITVRNLDAENREFSVYPTSTTGVLFMSEIVNVVVYDNTGKVMLKASQADQLDVSNLRPGMYLIKTDRNKSARFIIN